MRMKLELKGFAAVSWEPKKFAKGGSTEINWAERCLELALVIRLRRMSRSCRFLQ